MFKGLFLAGLLLAASVPGLAKDDAPAVRHHMQRGQTMAILARVYGVPVEDILAANPGVVPQSIPVGAEIVIPAPPTGWAEVAGEGGLPQLCARYGVLPQEVLQLNPGVQLGDGSPVLVPRSAEALAASADLAAGGVSGRPAEAGSQRQGAAPGGSASTGIAPGSDLTRSAATPSASAASTGPAAWPSASSSPPASSASSEGWVSVYLPDGTRGWAPRANLIISSKTPLPPDRVIAVAQQFEGTPYRWGGQTPNGVDCSGFIQEVYALSGYKLPRLADEQFQDTVPVTSEEGRPGDLVFFTTYLPGPSHVGIFLGDGKFLHASSSRGVTVASLQDDYFSPRFLGVRRLKAWAEAAVAPKQQAASTPAGTGP